MHETTYPALTQAISHQLASLRRTQEGTMAGFGAMAKGAMAAGALSEKHKELIALAISVSQRCAGCIGFHVKALRRLGASRAEFEEVLAWRSTWRRPGGDVRRRGAAGLGSVQPRLRASAGNGGTAAGTARRSQDCGSSVASDR